MTDPQEYRVGRVIYNQRTLALAALCNSASGANTTVYGPSDDA